MPDIGGRDEMGRAAEVIHQADRRVEDAFLALLGDKRFLWSDSGRSFLMFGVQGRAWIAAAEPVGREAEFDELASRFVTTARRGRAWPAFYAVSEAAAQRLARYRLTRHKVGERAVLDLAAFSLAGRDRRNLRNDRNRALKAGCRLEVVPPGPLDAGLAAELRAVSDRWLARRGGVEKTFSLGRFDGEYLSHFHLAVVRRGTQAVAFANVWPLTDLVTLDLMRYADEEEPGGGMDFLLVELSLWAQANGFRWLDLGLAPLAGLVDVPAPSAVARLGAFVYARGGRFYNFEGLRAYKDKFDPLWQPAYIVAGNQWRAGAAAVAVAALTGGGVRRLLRRTRAGMHQAGAAP